jgi:hypothetical protein
MLLLKIVVGNVTVTIGNIYGPNDDEKEFFDQLNDNILKFNSDFVILGGDWNTTYDERNNRTLNTAGVPSACRSL